MKLFNRFLTMGLMLLMGVASVACSDSEEVDKPQEVTKVTLSVSPAEIVADGTSAATFKVVTDLDTDVTKDVVITCNDGSTVSGAQFTTATAGTYTFKAAYGKLTSNEVTVTAKETGDAPTPGENKWVTTDVKTPITYAEGNYYGTDTSVGIEVRAAEKGSLRFVCTPGKEVKSYRVQYYSLSWIYNQLINQMNSEGKTELTTEDAENVVRAFMTNVDYEALAGQLFTASDESLGESYGSYEFDWLNMDHALPWPVQADADYLIVTLASFDEECVSEENFADMAICHVKTPEVALVGDPQVIIDVKPTYTSYSVTYTANEDCSAMYFLSNVSSEIDQYIEVYGDKMYRDFLRHYGARVELDEPYFMSTSSSQIADKTAEFSATAIALDVNGNPAEVINREDFQLRQFTGEEDHTIGGAKITNIRTAGSMMAFHVEMDMYCKNIYQSFYSLADAEAIMNGSEQDKKAVQFQLRENGWGIANVNFLFDTEKAVPVGEGFIATDCEWIDLQPETEYAIIYISRNGLGDLSDLQMVPFTTKKQVRDQPELCEDVYFEFEVTAPNVQSHQFVWKFDPDKVAKYWVYCYDPVRKTFFDINEETGDMTYRGYYTDPVTGITWYPPTPTADRETWLYWMIDYRDAEFGIPDTMVVETTTGYRNGSDSYILPGFDPGSTFKYACVFESWDGVISDVFYQEVTTGQLVFGENPTIDYTCEKTETGGYNFNFLGNEDVGLIHYTAGTHATLESLRLDYLYKKSPAYEKEQYIKFAKNFTIEMGLTAKSNTADMEIAERELDGKDLYVVLAIAEGAKDGNPVYSELVYLVWTKELQKFVTIDEYFAE